MPINLFKGRYRFLSNFYPVGFEYKGMTFETAEHAYQTEKAVDVSDREWIRDAPTPGSAKRRGRKACIRPDWENVKLNVMREIVEAKFGNKYLAELLLVTGNRELVEGNYWGDTFWGVCRGEGKNHLGKILMEVRQKLREKQ